MADYQVIVVGAGGGGPVVAKELAARGLKVLLLEAGARYFPPDEPPEEAWTHFESDANHPFSGFLRFGPSSRELPSWMRELPQRSALVQSSGVGGSTLQYFGHSIRAMPGVFAGYDGPDKGSYDNGNLFPFTYQELIPYYRWVEATLPVATAPMGTKEEVFFKGAEKMGLPHQTTKDITRAAFRAQENAILQPGGDAGMVSNPSFPAATGCVFCGHCAQGCILPLQSPRNQRAKRSTDNSYVAMALTADEDGWAPGGQAIELEADAFAMNIGAERDRGTLRARTVTWRNVITGMARTATADVIVLACGAVETPRLWLNSGLPNRNDWVGRGLTSHLTDLVVGQFDEDTNSSFGPASGARADFPGFGCIQVLGAAPANQASFMAFSQAGFAPFNGPDGSNNGALHGRVTGANLKVMMSDINKLLNILVLTDDHVERQNRVTLSEFMDDHGRIARVEVSPRKPRTFRNRDEMMGKAVELLKASGAKKVHRVDLPPALFHIHSTMRMGQAPGTSVLDENAESRAAKRLFIADNSALANSVGGPNPTLTTQALATRTAEKIFQMYFDGDPWVETESPVPSNSNEVTTALQNRGLA